MDTIDFDAWLEENERKPIEFKLLGEVWEIPGDLPAIVQLRLERIDRFLATATTDSVLPADLTLEEISYESLSRMMVGDEMFDQWLEAGIKDQHLIHVTQQLMGIYRGRGATQGKAPKKRKRKKKRPVPSAPGSSTPSSPTGEQSKPVGTPSTDQTSATS